MQYTLQWHIRKRVILLHEIGNVSIEDLRRFNQDLLTYLDEGDAPTHLLSIGENIRQVPTGLMEIRQTATFLQHPNMGWTMIIQEKSNPLTGFIISVATQATGMKLRHVKNITEGLETLMRIDQTLTNDVSPA